MSNKPVLFYSSKCAHSIDLWKKLKQNNLLDKLIKINVDKSNSIPAIINRTPTLLIKNRPPIVGQAIDFYLRSNNFSENNNRNMNRMRSNNSSTSQAKNVPESSIQDYLPGEMGSSWSDNYSFISDNKRPIDHSFQWLNNNSQIPLAKPGSINEKKSNIMDNRLESLKKERQLL